MLRNLLGLGSALLLLLGGSAAVAQSSGLNLPATVQVTPTTASSLVISGQHMLMGFHVTTATPGYAMIFDAASAPADGTVSPLGCFSVPGSASAGQSSTLSMANMPLAVPMTTGIAIVFSTTGCFTKTASATAFIAALYQ